MSWRRFLVLLRGLGPNSAYVNVLSYRKHRKEQVIEDPDEAERYVDAMFR